MTEVADPTAPDVIVGSQENIKEPTEFAHIRACIRLGPSKETNPLFPQCVIYRIVIENKWVPLALTNYHPDHSKLLPALIKGRILIDNCNQEYQFIQCFHNYKMFIIHKRNLLNLIKHYSINPRLIYTDYTIFHRDLDDASPENVGFGHCASLSYGSFYPINERILEFYKCINIKYIGNTYTIKPNADPLVLLLSCLSTRLEFKTKYLEFVDANKDQLRDKCLPLFQVWDNSFRIPEDVCIAISVIIFLNIGKGNNANYYTNFVNKRVAALRATYGAVNGYTADVPYVVSSRITQSIEAVPQLRQFFYRFLTDNTYYDDVRLTTHLRLLSKYKGMTLYKLTLDFLAIGVTLAHLKYIKPDELQYFLEKKRRLEAEGKDIPLLYFQEPNSIPISTNYQKLGALAVSYQALVQGSVNNITTRAARDYSGLQNLINQKLTEGTALNVIARTLGIRLDDIVRVKQLIENSGIGQN